jgi:hypothetical protein
MIRNVIEKLKDLTTGTAIKTFVFSYYADMLNTIQRNDFDCKSMPALFLSPPIETRQYDNQNIKTLHYKFEAFFVFNESIQTHNLPNSKRYDDLSLTVKYEMIVLNYFEKVKNFSRFSLKNLYLDYDLSRSVNGNFIVEARFEVSDAYDCTQQELEEVCSTG